MKKGSSYSPITKDQVEAMPSNLLVSHYLMATYLYYHCDRSPMTDEAYDLCCVRLDKEWDQVTHRHRELVDRESLAATTGFTMKVHEFPQVVLLAASKLWEEVESGGVKSLAATRG